MTKKTKTVAVSSTLDTLYCRDTMGRVRMWKLEVDGASYRTVAGLVDGEKVQSDWTVVEGKNQGRSNATTPEEQAMREAESQYTKKLKLGYFRSLEEIDTFTFVEPILAKNYNDYRSKIDLSKGQWWLNIKYNGIRMIATRHGLFTRKGEKFVSVPHIQNALVSFFKKYPDAVLDGECFNEQYRQSLNEIVKLARKTKNVSAKDLQRSEELIRFYVYDGYGFTTKLGEKAPYAARKLWIDNNVSGCYDYVEAVPEWVITSQHELDEQYNAIVSEGHEGGILRNSEMPYEHKRSSNLLKIKPLDDAEFIITNIQAGVGNWSGKAKIISLKSEDGKLVFDAAFKGSMEAATKLLKEKNKWIGKLVTIYYNGLSGLGCPQFARMDIANYDKGDR